MGSKRQGRRPGRQGQVSIEQRLATKLFDGVTSSSDPSPSSDGNFDGDIVSRHLSPNERMDLYGLYSSPSLGIELWKNIG